MDERVCVCVCVCVALTAGKWVCMSDRCGNGFCVNEFECMVGEWVCVPNWWIFV